MQKTLNRKIPVWLGIAVPVLVGVVLMFVGLGGPAGALDVVKGVGDSLNPAPTQLDPPPAKPSVALAAAPGKAR